MSENGIFLYFWTKKVIFKTPPLPPPSTYEKTNYKRKKGIFLYFGMGEKKNVLAKPPRKCPTRAESGSYAQKNRRISFS